MKNKNLLLAAVAIFTMTTAVQAQIPNYVPTNGLVGWWPFNGNANNESGTGNNGTVNGATLTTNRFGNANSAYAFNGTSSFINLGNSNTIKRYQTDYSISTWINSAAFSTLYYQSIISNRTASNNGGSKFGTGGTFNSNQGKLLLQVGGGSVGLGGIV